MCRIHGLDYVFMADTKYLCALCDAFSPRNIWDTLYAEEGLDQESDQETWSFQCTGGTCSYADGPICQTGTSPSLQVQANDSAQGQISTDPSQIEKTTLIISNSS